MRIRRLALIGLALLALVAGCDWFGSVDFGEGAFVGGGGGGCCTFTPAGYSIVGFPLDRVDRTVPGTLQPPLRLRVGDELTLRFVQRTQVSATDGPLVEGVWESTDSSLVVLSSGDGTARLRAVAPGRPQVRVNGQTWARYACDAAGTRCEIVGDIHVE